ncbi:MAG: prepilin-type N-terminal cleavage/methylation domain-containing protein [Verrucomicrobia bacterium]|nr:prepilin-type N-terminal cleavage/methylation domain-containing protein [Verrucomicrobiota bacterium]
MKIIPSTGLNRRQFSGFTMLEIMIVLGIAALLVTMSVPFVGGLFNENPIRDMTKNTLLLLEQARAKAILTGRIHEFVIIPGESKMIVRPVSSVSPNNLPASGGVESLSVGSPQISETQTLPVGSTGKANEIPEEIIIEMIAVNYLEKKDLPEAVVRFYPNGTSDKFTFIFNHGKGEYRLIRLDMMTGLADFEVDPAKFIDNQD